jgi:hypothetical protein
MEDERSKRETIFYEALQISDPAERDAFVRESCADNAALRDAVVALLAAHDQAESFFRGSDSAMKPPDEFAESESVCSYTDASVGSWIGLYKLVQWLGEGGGGVVYLAEQEEPVQRQVALKIIKLGMDTRRVIARFEAERQVLALMNHPNIAHVLDAGATETGRPFFVMELVHGIRITHYCEQNHVPLRQRLELFQQVCLAIQHAHQKGVIHRDIKPSNILITIRDGVPVPKIIDFGIAKATTGRLSERTVYTGAGQMIGTPAYMSPEQVQGSGMDVDTRSDIYSLGVVLYELLTSRPPFDNEELLCLGVDEMRRTICEREPQRPSAMVEMLQRDRARESAGHLPAPEIPAATLRGDLDSIVMKALEKDQSRRYETANGLAIDIRRYLNDEPIAARPPSRLYQFQKLVRRNKIIFLAATAVTAALVLGLGTSTWLFFKERESRRQAELGRANEVLLRQQAEQREKIAKAVVLVEQNQLDEADRVIGEIPSANMAMVGEAVFRPLADWAASAGRYKRASEYLSMLVQVDQYETSIISTIDHTECAVALMELGDIAAYRRFCLRSVRQFESTKDPLSAERTVKNTLLLPADEHLLAALAPMASVAAKSFPPGPGDKSWFWPWRSFSLGLLEYRRGNYSAAIAWGKCGMGYITQPLACVAATRAVLAMAYQHLGQTDTARDELSKSREMIDSRFKGEIYTGRRTDGLWFDWLLARILEREATAEIEGKPRPSK